MSSGGNGKNRIQGKRREKRLSGAQGWRYTEHHPIKHRKGEQEKRETLGENAMVDQGIGEKSRGI